MKLLSHYPSYLRSHGSPVKFPVIGKKKHNPIFKNGKREDPGNYRAVSLTPVPGKIIQ